MSRLYGRKLLWAYALLLLVAAFGYARYDLYMMDGDGTAFMDIAQDLNTHHTALAINGYWNPGYPALLAVAERLTHPTLWHELAVVRYTNVLLFLLAMAASLFFTHGLAAARQAAGERAQAVLPEAALHLLGLGLLTLSLGRELPVAAPRADTLLFALFLFAAGLLLRLLSGGASVLRLAALGVVLGCAYLTKSFAFLPSLVLLAGLLVWAVRRPAPQKTLALLGTGVAIVLFALLAGPYILAISHQLGHFTTGESARLNYAFFIDMTPRWHEWYRHDLGHAGGRFLHPEQPLLNTPPVFSFAAHPFGTFPLWFDPAYWTLGIKPHVWLKGHVFRLARNIVVFFRYLLGRPEPFVLMGVLLAFGASLAHRVSALRTRSFHAWWVLAPLLWGLLMLGIYFPIDLQDRYLTAPFFLVLLPLFAALRTRGESPAAEQKPWGKTQVVSSALVLLFAGTALAQSWTYLAERRRHIPPAEQQHAGFDEQMFTAAAALDALGLRPGDKIACMGDLACYTDHYWARLAGAQILAQVDTPDEVNPITLWENAPDKQAIVAPLRAMGLRYIVSLFPNSASKPEGWVELGQSNFFAYPLDRPLTPAEAQASAAFRAVP